jgi:hypothetical protein
VCNKTWGERVAPFVLSLHKAKSPMLVAADSLGGTRTEDSAAQPPNPHTETHVGSWPEWHRVTGGPPVSPSPYPWHECHAPKTSC